MTEETKEKVLVVQGTYALSNFQHSFNETYPFTIVQEEEFLREAESFIRDELISFLSDFKDLPRIIEIDMVPAELILNTKIVPTLEIYVSDSSSQERANQQMASYQIQGILEENIVDLFFDYRVEYLLTQKLIKADRKKKGEQRLEAAA
jgi:hypothetical protein